MLRTNYYFIIGEQEANQHNSSTGSKNAGYANSGRRPGTNSADESIARAG